MRSIPSQQFGNHPLGLSVQIQIVGDRVLKFLRICKYIVGEEPIYKPCRPLDNYHVSRDTCLKNGGGVTGWIYRRVHTYVCQ